MAEGRPVAINPMTPASNLPGATRFHDRVSLERHLSSTRLRQRVHGVGLMVVGGVALSTGLLVLDPGLASIVGAGMGGYGAYLCLR